MNINGKLPVFFCNDNGYTYGSVSQRIIGAGDIYEGKRKQKDIMMNTKIWRQLL